PRTDGTCVSSHAGPRGAVNRAPAYAVIARADGRGARAGSAWADDVLALAAELVDAEFHDVARLQPHRRREPHPDAGWRSGVDEVPGLQDEELAQVVHDEIRVEDHVRGRAGLPPDAVDVEPHAQGQDVADLVRGDQPRAGRVEGLGRLALAPLPAPLHLERPLAHVVDDEEAGDGLPGLGGGVQVAAAPADHHPQLDLP